MSAPVVVGTAKVMWAELQAANTTKATLLQAVDNLRVIVMDEVRGRQGWGQCEADTLSSSAVPTKQSWDPAAASCMTCLMLTCRTGMLVSSWWQVDRSIAPLGAYATLKEKRQKARHPKPSSRLLAEIYLRLVGPRQHG